MYICSDNALPRGFYSSQKLKFKGRIYSVKLFNLLNGEPLDTGEPCGVTSGNDDDDFMTKNDLATDSFEDAIETIEQGLTGPSESSWSTVFRKFNW